jgi:hypothetical protein
MKLDPGMHIVMHLLFFGKTGVTKDNPKKVNDFRPISLVNSAPKLVSNLLASRLQSVILEIVHQNQYGFIKGRTIQDCLGCAFEYLH